LYRVAVRADGGLVREDDTEAEPLDGDGRVLGGGEVVAMAVKELPSFVWRTFAEGLVALSEEGAVATHTAEAEGVELTEGKHYWEVELLTEDICLDLGSMFIGISRPSLDPTGSKITDGLFMSASTGASSATASTATTRQTTASKEVVRACC
jgi:hypothetical protein